MRIWPISLSTIAALLVGGAALSQDAMYVSHQPPTCLSSLCGKTVIEASVAGEPAPESVRIYFRAGSEVSDYYMEMTRTATGYSVVLPAPLRDTSSIVYRIVARGADGSTASSDPVTIPVTADCQLAALTPAQTAVAMNSVLGLTEASQTGAPKGFSCAGITKVVGVDETMAPNNACEEVRLAKSDPCFSVEGMPLLANAVQAETERRGAGLLGAAVLGGALVAGAVIIENNDDDEPVSRARP